MRLPWGFEAAHDLFPFSGRPVAAFDPVVQPLVGAVIGFWRKGPDRRVVAAQLVRHDDPGLAIARYQLLEETLGRLRIAAPLHENIHNIAIAVDGPPEPVMNAVDRNHDLVEMPFVVRSRTIAPDAACEMPTEPVDPQPHRLAADDNAALGQQILDIRRAQREPVIDPDRIGDNLTRISKAFQAGK